ncbi:MAG: PilN domain-containing protein [Desulfobacterales bacterium]|nr:PilN domain-containing protein [Desulfobacterales bacterium]
MAINEVNLIPFEFLSRRNSIRHLYLWTGCLLICLGIVFGVYTYQVRMDLTSQSPFKRLQETHTDTGSIVAEIKKLQDGLAQVDKQQTFVNTLTKNYSYALLISKLAELLNDQTWLTAFDVGNSQTTSADTRLKLNGLSFSNEYLGNFLNNLSKDPFFKTTTLNSVREMIQPGSKETGLVKLIVFEIECTL